MLDLYFIRYIRQKPQLLLAVAFGIVAWAVALFATSLQPLPAILIGWNGFTLCYLTMGWRGMGKADHQALLDHAHLYDDGEQVVLTSSIIAAVLSMVAIAAMLRTVPGAAPAIKTFHIVLAVITLVTSWLFIHTAFAFHYAYGYYVNPSHETEPPLTFPGKGQPLYSDFLYFSFVIGTSGQTADVAFACRVMRRIGTVHCVVAYLFNAAVLGLTVNIAASLISSK
ncbi:MAG: DUF1345 domain-containing protein [Asticcacaulis sp.]|nr:DUF1345 domain-containing protein [Asticcacaulis sp.]